jgi:hypothetical protein
LIASTALYLLVGSLGALLFVVEPVLEALLDFFELLVLLLVLGQAVTEVEVLRELDVEVLLVLDIGLDELAQRVVVASAAEPSPSSFRPCRTPSRAAELLRSPRAACGRRA